MKKFIKKLLKYRKYKASNHCGIGYTQGIGFDLNTEVLEILGFRFITQININVKSQWIRDLKKRMEADDKQQKIEKTNE